MTISKMDISTSTNLILFIAAVVFLWKMVNKYHSKQRIKNLVNKLPSLNIPLHHLSGLIIGHLYVSVGHRFHAKIKGVPWGAYDFMALTGYNYLFSKGSLTNIWQMHKPFIVVFKADSIEMILSHSTELKKAWFYDFLHPWLGQGLLTSDSEKWKTRRRLLTPAFHFNILRDFLQTFNLKARVLTEQVLDKHTDKNHVDIVPLITRCSLDIICESILGAETNTQTESSSPYVKAIVELGSMTFERMQTPWYWNDYCFKMAPFGWKFLKNVKLIDEFTSKIIRAKKLEKINSIRVEKPETDVKDEVSYKRNTKAFLDLLLEEHLKDSNALSEEGVREEVNTFVFEGHDTTATAMSWSLYLIGLHPWVQTKVHDEMDAIFGDDDDRDATMEDIKDMKYLECVIKETLRLYPSVPAYGRKVQEDILFQNYTLPQGSTILVYPYILHRDPAVFPNPEKFDPERFTPENSVGRHPYAYVPFSAGPRNCIGQRFALLEAKTVLSSVFRKYKVRSLDPRDKVFPLDELVLRSAQGLRLQIRKRKNQDFDFHKVYYRP